MLLKKTATVAAAGVFALTLAACGSSSSTADSSAMTSGSMTSSMTSAAMDSGAMDSGAMNSGAMKSGAMNSGAMKSGAMKSGADPAADLVGPGCAAYAEKVPNGAGSVSGMAGDPVATAASNNPLLTTLTAAVSGKLNPKVNLVSTLNNGQYTVFAPVDKAFEKIPADTIDTLKTDSDLLTSVLTYHVISGQLSPNEIDGTHATVNGADVTVTGSGDTMKVNDANVICGGVHTANATVYLIDTVLMPPKQ